jgi:DNA-directed RNA polymerase specialized sigma24 family protein
VSASHGATACWPRGADAAAADEHEPGKETTPTQSRGREGVVSNNGNISLAMDERVSAWLRATDAVAEEECLRELMTQCAEPIIQRTVAARLAGRWEEIGDVCSEARLELLLYLRRIKSKHDAQPIEDFAAYVGTLARNTCFHYFRRRRPGRARLAKQIRFLLQEPGFHTWQRNGVTWCGLAEWSDDRIAVQSPGLVDTLDTATHDMAALLRHVFERAKNPIAFDALVNTVADVWKIADEPDPLPLDVDAESIPSTAPGIEISIDRRRYAQRLWQEIGLLPRPQRFAILLNLRDGRGNSILSLFPLSGVASFAETAAVLEVSEAQLASIWVELPWDDNAIARFLSRTRQQIINLRMAARKRLANRLGVRP